MASRPYVIGVCVLTLLLRAMRKYRKISESRRKFLPPLPLSKLAQRRRRAQTPPGRSAFCLSELRDWIALFELFAPRSRKFSTSIALGRGNCSFGKEGNYVLLHNCDPVAHYFNHWITKQLLKKRRENDNYRQWTFTTFLWHGGEVYRVHAKTKTVLHFLRA